MKIAKQLLYLMPVKDLKTGKYHNIAIATLTVFLLPSTIPTAFASSNIANIKTFDYPTQPSSVDKITHKQIFPTEPTILVADKRNSSKEDISITSFRQSFDKAWQEQARKKALFTVCNNEETKYQTLLCLDVLELYLKNKISSWTSECHKQRANLVLCLGFFEDKGTTSKDLEQWIKESDMLRQKIINAPN